MNQHWYGCSRKKTTNLHWWSPDFWSNQQLQKKMGESRFLNLRRNSMRMEKSSPKHIFSQMVGKPWMVVIFIPMGIPFSLKKIAKLKQPRILMDFMVVWWWWIPFGKIRKKSREKKHIQVFGEHHGSLSKEDFKEVQLPPNRAAWLVFSQGWSMEVSMQDWKILIGLCNASIIVTQAKILKFNRWRECKECVLISHRCSL